MKNENNGNSGSDSEQVSETIERRSLVKAMGATAIAGLAVSASTANAQSGRNNGFRPMRHSEDAWLDELDGSHRVYVDTSTSSGASNALLYAGNILNAHGQAYAGNDEDYAMIVCFRHFSTPFAFSDDVWEKYGEFFHAVTQMPDPDTGNAPSVNLLNVAATRLAPGTTKDEIEARGVNYAVCANATGFFSGMIAGNTGGSQEDIFAELVGSISSNSHMVSAGVIATTRAQEYGYSLLYSA